MSRLGSLRLKRTYGAREVAAATGLSARQLQLWESGGLLRPAIPSHRTAAGGYTERRYTPLDLFDLVVLADLRQRGFSIAELHTIVRVLRKQFGVRLFEATGDGNAIRLLTDGEDVYARTTAGEYLNLLDTPPQPLLVVGDERRLKEVGKSVAGRRRRKKRVS